MKGQFTNLKAQARSLGLEEKWPAVANTYADVNQMFGDIVKVTPSSKVVGDMALMMVAQGLTRAQVEDPAVDVAFPDSVADMLKGNIGQPHGGWPVGIQKKVLKGDVPLTERPGKNLPAVDLEATRAKLIKDLGGYKIDDEDLNGYLMYPKVFLDYITFFMVLTTLSNRKVFDFTEMTFNYSNRPISQFDFAKLRSMNEVIPLPCLRTQE